LYLEHVRVALGLHPQLVTERAAEVPLFERFLSETRYVGEVGLDAGPRYFKSFTDQERVFSRILAACAEHGDQILTLHSVRAVRKVLDDLESRLLRDHGRAVLHWFTGTPAGARRAVELGCYFSINSGMMNSPRHRALVAKLPLDRLLTETDGPFVSINDRVVRPLDVARTLAMLADTLALSAVEAEHLVLRNLAALTRPF
jgi:TatD DNase family protein